MKLTKQNKVKLLTETIKEIKTNYRGNGSCLHIVWAGRTLGMTGNQYDFSLPNQMPEFTYENAIELAKKYKFKKPDNGRVYWWNPEDTKPRIKFLQALIKELQLK
jgi:hypothetical protein